VDLLPGDDARVVADMTHELSDFVSRALNPSSEFKIENSKFKILLHGHCHQKALWGTAGTRAALTQAGYDVREIESTCCGMAGAFGYEAEHVELSRRIGELAVLPAVRAAAAEAMIVAPGTSCREQIRAFTGRTALHPVQALAAAMEPI
jgi:Fe-S oxidoreductase